MRWSERKLIAQISLELYVALLRGQTSGTNALIFPFKIKGQHKTKSEQKKNDWGAQALGLLDSGYPFIDMHSVVILLGSSGSISNLQW